MTLSKSLGVIYIATGKKYIDEACQSGTSLKLKNPDIHVTFFSSEGIKYPCFDRVIVIDNPRYSYEDKVKYMKHSPYDYTLFLDTDTYICSDISDMFTLLDEFDIASAHSRIFHPIEIEGVPQSFERMNTGVILFKNSEKMESFFSEWQKLHELNIKEKGEEVFDSLAFSKALYKSKLRIATLPSEYNFRFRFSTVVCQAVKILHGRYPEISLVSQEINDQTGVRFYVMGIGLINDTKLLKRINRLSSF